MACTLRTGEWCESGDCDMLEGTLDDVSVVTLVDASDVLLEDSTCEFLITIDDFKFFVYGIFD